jgi:hypothetical protein
VALTEVLEKVKDPLTGREKPGFQWPLWDDFTLTYLWKTWYTNKPTKHLLGQYNRSLKLDLYRSPFLRCNWCSTTKDVFWAR